MTANSGSSNHPTAAATRGPVRRLLLGRVAAIGILFLGAGLLLKDSSLFEPSYEAIYQEYQKLVARAKGLSEEKAAGAGWSELRKEADQKLPPIVAKLKKLTEQKPLVFKKETDFSVNYFIRRPLLQIGQFDLPRLLRQGEAGKLSADELASLEQALQNVRKSLDAVSLDVPSEAQIPPGLKD